MDRLTFYPIGDSYLLVAVVTIALAAILYAIPPGATGRRRATLIWLRAVVIFLLLLAMLRPTLVRREINPQAATLVVLADDSRSMSVPDASGGRKTRYESMRDTLADSTDQLAALAEKIEVVPFTFDFDLNPSEMKAGQITLPEKPEGNETAIGAALEGVLRQEAGKRLLGVVLFSDGAQRAYAPKDTAPQNPARHMKRLGIPLYTVAFGQARGLSEAKDAAVEQLLIPQTIFLNNRLPVEGQVRLDGFLGRDVPVKLLFETVPETMTPVAGTLVRAEKNNQTLPVRMDYVPTTPGQYKVTLEIPPQPGELITTNNRKSSFIRVLAGGLRVLYLERFPPRRETKFLRRSLDASQEIEVDYLSLAPGARPGALIDRFDAEKYQVFILGDVDSEAFTPDELTALSKAVQNGAGLLMLGGFHAFGPGGYAQTPLADVAPVKMSRLERQKPGEPIREDLHLPGPLSMRPSELGKAHYLLRLAETTAKNLDVWKRLPPLAGANRFDQTKPGAVVLAETKAGKPILAATDYGAGRVIAFAGDTTWRWVLRGFDEAHKRFWRQAILWLAKKDMLGEGNVWVRLSDRRLRPGQALSISAGARTATGDPVSGARFEVEVAGPAGDAKPVRLKRKLPGGEATPLTAEQAVGQFDETRAAGDYTVRVRAFDGETSLGEAQTRFLVFTEDLELDHPVADLAGMENWAELAGGRPVVPEQLAPLWGELAERAETFTETIESRKTYWDRWWFFSLVVGLLSVEWFLRKHWGLV